MADKKNVPLPDSEDAYEELKVITDAAQAGKLSPWSPAVTKLLTAYGINVTRKKGMKVEATLFFPETKPTSMAIGIRHMKEDGSYAEDMFLFEKGVGLTKLYKGDQERLMPEYKGTHHAQPNIALHEALPDIQKELDAIKKSVTLQSILDGINMADIYTESSLHAAIEAQTREQQQEVHNLHIAHPQAPIELLSRAVTAEITKKRAVVREKYFASERLYEAKKKQIEQLYSDPQGVTDNLSVLNDLFGKQQPKED